MKISELAARTGIPLATVKFYQREGLLPPGEKSAPNQAEYGEAHVQRLNLIRALMGVGGLGIAATKEVIDAFESVSLGWAFGVAQRAISGASRPQDPDPSPASRERVVALVKEQGWNVEDANPGIDIVARALDGFAAMGLDVPPDYLASFASAAAEAAEADMKLLEDLPNPEQAAEVMVVGTVLGDPLFAGLRRIAQEHASRDHFPAEEPR